MKHIDQILRNKLYDLAYDTQLDKVSVSLLMRFFEQNFESYHQECHITKYALEQMKGDTTYKEYQQKQAFYNIAQEIGKDAALIQTLDRFDSEVTRVSIIVFKGIK